LRAWRYLAQQEKFIEMVRARRQRLTFPLHRERGATLQR
jgi:hypothetical protein